MNNSDFRNPTWYTFGDINGAKVYVRKVFKVIKNIYTRHEVIT